jgi:tRNA-splicing ligase RtcB
MPALVLPPTDGTAIKIWTEDIEDSALQQLRNLAAMPFIHKHIAAMPDVHWGMGATVGSVIAAKRAVIPAAVGVDIGCGMMAVKTNLNTMDLPDNMGRVRCAIERSVPVGFNSHEDMPRGKRGEPLADLAALHRTWEPIIQKHPKIRWKSPAHLNSQLGTLGGGNHFIEICLDLEGSVWIMLHSGSRNIGKVIADYFISRAKELMERYFITLPDKDLAFFAEGESDFDDYIEAVSWAQSYALANREAMMKIVLAEVEHYFPQMKVVAGGTNCHHNYVSRENHFGANVILTRKGAISAREGELGIIPGSMGTRSFIVRGRGNKDSFESCSHGAGRRMSRTEAKHRFTADDLAAQTVGVDCRKDAGVVDEIPAAYKDIDTVMKNQEDLVEIVTELRQIVCVKG